MIKIKIIGKTLNKGEIIPLTFDPIFTNIFNNEEKTIDNIEGNSYDLSFDLKDGENFVIIRAYEGNVKSEYKGKTTK